LILDDLIEGGTEEEEPHDIVGEKLKIFIDYHY